MYFSRIYKIIIAVFLFFLVVNGMAQDIINSTIVEQRSYQLYLDKNWSELTKYGNKAISKEYDYFYLRMRIGIAYYEQKKHMRAIKHFEKAVEFNSADTLALEYLYYSYVFSGRSNQAKLLTEKFNAALHNKIKPPKNKFINGMYIEGGPLYSNLNDNYKNIDIDGIYNKYGEAAILKNMQYWQFGLKHQLSSKFSIYQGYSNIKLDLTKNIRINNKDTWDNYPLTQHDYYVSFTKQYKHFSFSPALHLIKVDFTTHYPNFSLTPNEPVFRFRDTSFTNYVTSFSLTKNKGIYTCNLSAGFSQLNGFTQIQTGFALTYYPKANTNFYGTSSLVYLNESNLNGSNWRESNWNESEASRVIAIQRFGLKLAKKLWAEAGITYGNQRNYYENNAFVVFNTADKILYKYSFYITSSLLKHIELSIRYDYFSRENTYINFNDLYQPQLINVNYQTQSIIGGIKWKF